MSKFQDYVPQPFPIYKQLPLHPDFGSQTDFHYQNHRLNQCKGNTTTWQQVLPYDGSKIGFPPFMVRRPSGGASITSWQIKALDGAIFSTLSGVSSSVEYLDDVPDWEAVIFPSQQFTFSPSLGKPYFIRLNDGVNYYYSDIFYFGDAETLNAIVPFSTIPNPCGTEDYIQLSWSNTGCIISETFPTAGVFMLNLPVSVSQPEYDFQQETEPDGQGGTSVITQRLDKRYSFFITAPECIADALTAAQMFSDIGISFQYYDSLSVRDFAVDVQWDDPCFAKITVSFAADFLKKTSCCV